MSAVFVCLAPQPQSKLYGWYALNLMCWALMLCFMVMTDPWPFSSTPAFAKGNLLVFIAFTYTFCIFTLRFAELRLMRLSLRSPAYAASALYLHCLCPMHR
jgi:hypothetical protein